MKATRKTDKKKSQRKNNQQHEQHDNHVASEGTSYYYNGSVYNPQTEIGIMGAYGSQGEEDTNNSYTRAVTFKY